MAMMSKQSSRTMISANGRRKRRFAVATMMCMVAMAMISLFATTRTTIFLVVAMPLIEDSIGDSTTATMISQVETIVAEGAATTTSTSVAKSSSASTSSGDCIDDSSFLYKEKEGKNCEWVGGGNTKKKRKRNKMRKKRCKKVYLGESLAKRCRNTCNYNKCTKLTVGVYYYPWWGSNFHRGNPNNPDLYLRSQLQKQELPALGEYNDTEPDVIEQHLKWSRKYNIHLWVTSWWGKDKREDLTIKNNILNHPKLGNQKIAIFYETTGRISEKSNHNLKEVHPDLEYLCQQYFNHANYYKKVVSVVDDNGNVQTKSSIPVIFVYLTRKLETLGLLNETIALMRKGARDGGCEDIFIVGDQVFQGPPSITDNVTDPDLIPFELMDGVTNYDVYGSLRGGKNLGYVGTREKVTQYYQGEQREWKKLAQSKGCAFIPGTSPGFNDRGVRPEKDHIPLSRRLNLNAKEGSLFRAALQEARTLVDPQLDHLIMVNSFNEFHEDTQIEPVVAVDGSKGLDSQTNLPTNLTYGLEYEAYENLYLNILKQETKKWDVSSLAASAASTVASTSVTKAASTIQTEEMCIPSSTNEDITTISDIIGLELD